MLKKLILPLWFFAGVCLFLYSFTQVDLSLTLSQASIYQTVEKWFQYVGWFNRPLSASLYLLIVGLMSALYLITLNLIKKKHIEWKIVWKIVICLSVILFFAYNAFSYDLFNYIFDAKILVHYHANPYLHKALDYPGDPMLSFMHWTHRTYPYGPLWIAITAPIYFVGFGIFSLTFYLFKLLMTVSFVGSVWLISKIAKKLDLDPAFSVAAFALNPLVLIESLVSAHNDIVMMFFGLLGLYMFLEKKFFTSVISIVVSILIKFATILMIPAVLLKKFGKIKDEAFLNLLVISMCAAVFLAVVRSSDHISFLNFQYQPWYLLYVLPFSALIQKKYFIAIPVIILSIASLLQYVPYLYLGNYNSPVPEVMNEIMLSGIIVSALMCLWLKLFSRSTIKN